MGQKTGICLIALFIAMAVAIPPGAGTAGAEVTLTYSNFFPPTHIQSKLSESWCKEVEKRTEGRVKIQYFAGQTLTKANQTYDSVVDSIADIGTSALAYTRGRFPVESAIDLPFGYTSGVQATAAANALYNELHPKEFSDTQVMYLHAHGPGLIHTRDKAVTKLEDMKGLKIRSTGTSAEVVKALGGTPVPMPMPDCYQSLQKGVVDGSAYPVEANKGWKLGEVVDYVTLDYPAAYTTTFFVVMNKDKWNSLSKQDQAIISQINKQWSVQHGEAWDSSDKEGLVFFKSQKGNKVIALGKEEGQRWKDAVAPLIKEYAVQLDKQGLDGAKVITAIKKTLN